MTLGVNFCSLRCRLRAVQALDTHPDVWDAFDKIVAVAKSRGITVVANTGYVYKTKKQILERVEQLYAHGARVVMIQGIEFLIEAYASELLNDLAAQIVG